MDEGTVSWASRQQTIVAQSTAEAEYVVAWEACIEGQGLRNLLIDMFPMVEVKHRYGNDNRAAVMMATNTTYSRRTRHIELRWHYTVELWNVKTDNNPSDFMTKRLSSDRFELLSETIGVTKNNIPKDVAC
ncbi:Copiatype Polyprotein [Phytophthora palmivora]|uniref:Copiatype Polyprotein n=1 Tax=Phytophthora palmivora TaxID=4796 RepID=A0A2P4X7X1_9STRA|nr:Copiatype Polyprotein [Phytophthora palmivora]